MSRLAAPLPRAQVPKPEGLGIDDMRDAFDHMYPASMIEFIEKSASMGGEVSEAFSNLHEEAEKLLKKAAPSMPDVGGFDTPSFDDLGLPTPGDALSAIGDRIADAGDEISKAVGKISKAVVGDLVGDVILGSNPVTGVLLGIRKTYKLTKKVRRP